MPLTPNSIMKKKRRTKWKWAPHFHKMAELYLSGLSIPQIHKDIQCDNFRPSQRSVYDKFRDAGLPTDHSRGSRSHRADSPADTDAGGTLIPQKPIIVQRLQDTIPTEDHWHIPASKALGTQADPIPPQRFGQKGSDVFRLPLRFQRQNVEERLQAGVSSVVVRQKDTEHIDSATIEAREDIIDCTTALRPPGILQSEEPETIQAQIPNKKAALRGQKTDAVMKKLMNRSLLKGKDKRRAHHSGGRTKQPYRIGEWRDSPSNFCAKKATFHDQENDTVTTKLMNSGLLREKDKRRAHHSGGRTKQPYRIGERRDPPSNLYASSKGSDRVEVQGSNPGQEASTSPGHCSFNKVRHLLRLNSAKAQGKQTSLSAENNLVETKRVSVGTNQAGASSMPFPGDPKAPTCKPPYQLPEYLCPASSRRGRISVDSGCHSLASSTSDGTYYSMTSSTLYARDTDSVLLHAKSLTESQELHRIACKDCEQTLPDQYREIKSCHSCGCSSIHNLAWSASGLTLQEFQAELRSENDRDLRALDAAGNSALHYAAASGASCGHLEALIEKGIPLHQRNTANQNFLHCLRPRKALFQSGDWDCFESGLIKLLRSLPEHTVVLGQQDNDGQTVLHALASHITTPALREDTFRVFTKAGFPPKTVNRFGKSSKEVYPDNYEYAHALTGVSTFKTPRTTTPDLDASLPDWQKNRRKQEEAYKTIFEAQNNPHYVNKTTKDTVLHALSRVDVQHPEAIAQNIDIMQDLRKFASKRVNLNLHNRDGDHPLSAIIRNKHLRGDTGATVAKTLEALLYKDGRRGTTNDLNDINVDMMNRRGATALYEAATQALPEAVRSLIEAGANVNARLNDDPKEPSILQAILTERETAERNGDRLREHQLKEVQSHLEDAGAVEQPSSLQQRGRGHGRPK